MSFQVGGEFFGQVVYRVSPGAFHVYSIDFAEVNPKNKKGGSNKS